MKPYADVVIGRLSSGAQAAVPSEDEIGPYWVPLGLLIRLTPDGKVEATDIHDDVSRCRSLYLYT